MPLLISQKEDTGVAGCRQTACNTAKKPDPESTRPVEKVETS